MEKTVDLRGLVCPEPVLRAKKLLDESSVQLVEALVDSEVNVNNLQRLARSLKIHFEWQSDNDFFRVTMRKSDHAHSHNQAGLSHENSEIKPAVGTVVFLSKDRFGDGDAQFSGSLLNLFLQTLLQSGHKPRAILMANSGVKLMDSESSVVKVLDDFRQAGVEVLACGLCVEYYGLKERIRSEQITNMFAICEFLMAADKVIQP